LLPTLVVVAAAVGGASSALAAVPEYTVTQVVAPVLQINAAFGERIRALGDVDGDGARDLLVSTPSYDGVNPTGGAAINNSGRAYIFSGRTRELLRTIEPPGTPEANEKFGFWSANLGDVNGDGAADFVTSANGKVVAPVATPTGQVYVISGKTGTVLNTINAPESLLPTGAFGGDFGGNVIAPGDLTGDGSTDFVATSSGAAGGAGAAFAFDGKTGAFLYKVTNPDAAQPNNFGFGASEVGDVNGDDRADYLIGAPLYDAGTAAAGMDVGRAYVINGRTGTVLFTLDNPPGEAEAGDRFGAPDADGISLGDVTGDGKPDVYVNSVSGNEPQIAGPSLDNAGKVFTFNGATGALIRVVHDPLAAGSRSFGVGHASAADLDADGRPDSLIGVRAGGNGIGAVTAFSGASLGTPGTNPATVLKVFADPAAQPGALFGAGIASPADVNADGLPDYFVAARSYDVDSTLLNVGTIWAYTSIAPPRPPTTTTTTPTTTPPPTTIPPPPASVQVPVPKPPTPRKGRISARVLEAADLRAPFRFTTTGRLTLPRGVAKANGCKGKVSVQVKRGSTTISTRRVSLRKDCTYSVRVTFVDAKRFAHVKSLKFTARFLGNALVLPATASPRFARVRR